jgi:hypothetical protein
MIRSTFIALTAILFTLLNFARNSADEKTTYNNNNDVEKFQAHKEVQILQSENLKKINLLEIISKNFGYTDYKKFQKDYWTARILVSKKQIIQAKYLLIKNKREMDENLKIISIDYQNATQEMLDECLNKINEFEFTASSRADYNTRKKTLELRDKIRIATRQFENAYDSFNNQVYISSITLYRRAKSYAIYILKDLAEPEEKNKIEVKFKIHIVDNRNEIYKEG